MENRYWKYSDSDKAGALFLTRRNEDVTPNEERNPAIGLGHELIHGFHAISGKMENTKDMFKADPDSPENWLMYISTEEYKTRKEENILRNEMGAMQRMLPN